MSPCTKKLSDLKGKRFKKYVFLFFFFFEVYAQQVLMRLFYSAGKPQSLFAKLGKKSYEQSSSAEQGRTSAE